MEYTLEELNTNQEKHHKYIMDNIENKLQWLKENTDHNIIYIALQGSQNYDMQIYSEDYMSDVDVKAICIPSLDDIVRSKKMFSHTYEMEDDSHIDVKDIRLYINLWKKSNPQLLEILFTKYYICMNEKFRKILNMGDRIAAANPDKLLNCIMGMQMQKYKALKHPYPKIKEKIEKYGYDPKQAHHIIRLLCFGLNIFIENKTFRESLIPTEIDKLRCLDLKLNSKSLESIECECSRAVNDLGYIGTMYKNKEVSKIDEQCHKELENIIYEIILDEIKECVE